jgi:hypothetical protein
MRNDLELQPLLKLLQFIEHELLERMIKEFSCARDSDVEFFLKYNAISYEQKGISRTYLYLTEAIPRRIAAYFAVGITATSFQNISKSRKSKVLGFKPGRDTKDHFGGIIVGQLARADGFNPSDINGKEIIKGAEYIIERGREYLGGKIVYIDCREPLIKFYTENGYSLVVSSQYPNGYYKMYSKRPAKAY